MPDNQHATPEDPDSPASTAATDAGGMDTPPSPEPLAPQGGIFIEIMGGLPVIGLMPFAPASGPGHPLRLPADWEPQPPNTEPRT